MFNSAKLMFWGALAAAGALFIAHQRRDAVKDERVESKIEDLENANEILERVNDSHADPERLREFDNSGFRD